MNLLALAEASTESFHMDDHLNKSAIGSSTVLNRSNHGGVEVGSAAGKAVNHSRSYTQLSNSSDNISFNMFANIGENTSRNNLTSAASAGGAGDKSGIAKRLHAPRPSASVENGLPIDLSFDSQYAHTRASVEESKSPNRVKSIDYVSRVNSSNVEAALNYSRESLSSAEAMRAGLPASVSSSHSNASGASKAVLAALQALQDKIRRVEAERTCAQEEVVQCNNKLLAKDVEMAALSQAAATEHEVQMKNVYAKVSEVEEKLRQELEQIGSLTQQLRAAKDRNSLLEDKIALQGEQLTSLRARLEEETIEHQRSIQKNQEVAQTVVWESTRHEDEKVQMQKQMHEMEAQATRSRYECDALISRTRELDALTQKLIKANAGLIRESSQRGKPKDKTQDSDVNDGKHGHKHEHKYEHGHEQGHGHSDNSILSAIGQISRPNTPTASILSQQFSDSLSDDSEYVPPPKSKVTKSKSSLASVEHGHATKPVTKLMNQTKAIAKRPPVAPTKESREQKSAIKTTAKVVPGSNASAKASGTSSRPLAAASNNRTASSRSSSFSGSVVENGTRNRSGSHNHSIDRSVGRSRGNSVDSRGSVESKGSKVGLKEKSKKKEKDEDTYTGKHLSSASSAAQNAYDLESSCKPTPTGNFGIAFSNIPPPLTPPLPPPIISDVGKSQNTAPAPALVPVSVPSPAHVFKPASVGTPGFVPVVAHTVVPMQHNAHTVPHHLQSTVASVRQEVHVNETDAHIREVEEHETHNDQYASTHNPHHSHHPHSSSHSKHGHGAQTKTSGTSDAEIAAINSHTYTYGGPSEISGIMHIDESVDVVKALRGTDSAIRRNADSLEALQHRLNDARAAQKHIEHSGIGDRPPMDASYYHSRSGLYQGHHHHHHHADSHNSPERDIAYRSEAAGKELGGTFGSPARHSAINSILLQKSPSQMASAGEDSVGSASSLISSGIKRGGTLDSVIRSLEEEFTGLNNQYRRLLSTCSSSTGNNGKHSENEAKDAEELVIVIHKLHRKGEQLRKLRVGSPSMNFFSSTASNAYVETMGNTNLDPAMNISQSLNNSGNSGSPRSTRNASRSTEPSASSSGVKVPQAPRFINSLPMSPYLKFNNHTPRMVAEMRDDVMDFDKQDLNATSLSADSPSARGV